MPSTNNRNTNKFKQDVRSPNRCRYYANVKNAFYKRSDEKFIRAVPCFGETMLRRCDEKGQIIPRIRMSKKLKLRFRRSMLASQAA
jgi:hypothetical protein